MRGSFSLLLSFWIFHPSTYLFTSHAVALVGDLPRMDGNWPTIQQVNE